MKERGGGRTSIGERLRGLRARALIRARRLIDTPHPPEHAARGAGLGMFVALTPTLGIQIPVLTGIWLVVQKRWPFNLPLAIALTLTTNFATMPPLFYLYVATGRILLGRADETRDYDTFTDRFETAMGTTDPGFWESISTAALSAWKRFGAPLIVGALPWSVIGALASYYLVLSFVRRRRRAQLPGG